MPKSTAKDYITAPDGMVTARIETIGGVLLHWFGEESEENRLRVVND
jgi:hypothetical protein